MRYFPDARPAAGAAVNDTNKQCRIRSYVLRSGRLTRAQGHALANYAEGYLLPYTPVPVDLDAAFKRPADKVLDIGSGMGDATCRLAETFPHYDFLAVEVYAPGVGNMLNQIQARKITNLRIIQHDVVEVLQHQITPGTFTAVTVYFPDPWPKKRHHKRRLFNAGFLRLLLPTLCAHGQLYIATDDAGLAEHTKALCDREPGLINLAGQGNYAPRPHWRPATRFERRGLRLHHTIRELIYCKTT